MTSKIIGTVFLIATSFSATAAQTLDGLWTAGDSASSSIFGNLKFLSGITQRIDENGNVVCAGNYVILSQGTDSQVKDKIPSRFYGHGKWDFIEVSLLKSDCFPVPYNMRFVFWPNIPDYADVMFWRDKEILPGVVHFYRER